MSSILQRIREHKPLFRVLGKQQQPIPQRLRSTTTIYSRKEKSLEELSKRFLRYLIEYDHKTIQLDRMTQQLDVERRRLYDIINILESLRVVTRKCKNKYLWNGFSRIYQTIQEMQQTDQSPISEQDGSNRREKSLEVLSVGFLRLFINIQPLWTLEEAAKRLSLPDIEEGKLKTRIRRLYDIANVLKSIGLICKTHVDRKAAYRWVGEAGLKHFSVQLKQLPVEDDFEEDSEDAVAKKVKVEERVLQPRVDVNQVIEIFFEMMKNRKVDANTEKKQQYPPVFDQNLPPFTPKIRQTYTIIRPPTDIGQ